MIDHNERFEKELEARARRRFKSDEKSFDRLDRSMERAEKLIGEVIRDGQVVYYCWPQGGRYREGSHFDLTMFLIRNNYV